jgi:hypothetical protein
MSWCQVHSGACDQILFPVWKLLCFLCGVPSLTIWLKSQSHVPTDGRSVSQYVLMSSSLWNLWPDIIFGLKVAVLSLWGALSDERSGLPPVSHCHQCLLHCQRFNIIYIVVTCFKYTQYILDLCQAQYSTSFQNLCYNSSLDTWTAVRLTAAKFKPCMFSVLGFALTNIADIHIFMILYNFCLLPA